MPIDSTGKALLENGRKRIDMIIGATGHQNLPSKYIDYFRGSILKTISSYKNDVVGVCSLAGGADQLFAEIILSCGGELCVIVPSDGYDATFRTPYEKSNYHALLSMASRVEELNYMVPNEEAYMAAGQKTVDLADILVAIWDGLPASGFGGTADVVKYAIEKGKKVTVIWPKGVKR